MGLTAATLAAAAGTRGAVSGFCRPVVHAVSTPAHPRAFLQGVAVSPQGDVWAVGHLDGPPYGAVALHRTSTRFVQVPVPRGTEELRGVVALSATDAWAVGMDGVLHWDGRRWSRAPGASGSLWSISASAPDDVWTVGTGAGGLLVLHWDGKRWRSVPFAPVPAASQSASGGKTYDFFSYLEGVLALGPDDVWTVGTGSDQKPIAAHWDGTSWLLYPVRATFTGLGSLAADPSGHVWASGGLSGGAVAAEWDGAAWRLRGPRVGASGAVAVRKGEVWAVRDDAVARWNGTAWAPLEKRHPEIALESLAVDAQGSVWAAGYRLGETPRQRSLVYRYTCGTSP